MLARVFIRKNTKELLGQPNIKYTPDFDDSLQKNKNKNYKTFHHLYIAVEIKSDFLIMSAKPYVSGPLAISLPRFSPLCTSLIQLQTHWFNLSSAQDFCLCYFLCLENSGSMSSNGYSIMSLCSLLVRLFLIDTSNWSLT